MHLIILPPLPSIPLFPYTTLFRSPDTPAADSALAAEARPSSAAYPSGSVILPRPLLTRWQVLVPAGVDRKSTRLNSSHQITSYAVFCSKKKTDIMHDIDKAVTHTC